MEIKYPKGEKAWTLYSNIKHEPVFLMTSKPARDFYFLYEILPDGSLNKLGKARTPPELEKKFNVIERCKMLDISSNT